MVAGERRTDLLARGVQPVRLGHREGDVTDLNLLSRLFQAHRPSLLLNCAAHTGVDQCDEHDGHELGE